MLHSISKSEGVRGREDGTMTRFFRSWFHGARCVGVLFALSCSDERPPIEAFEATAPAVTSEVLRANVPPHPIAATR